MEGLDACALVTVGSLFAMAICARRYWPIPLLRRLEIAFLVAGSGIWIAGMIVLIIPSRDLSCILLPNGGDAGAAAARCGRRESTKEFAVSEDASRLPLPGRAPADTVPDDNVNLSEPLRGLDKWTAVYDIAAHTVYLPDGTSLEAHSGLGVRLDDPRYVHERMRGATPPNTYELSLREKPFHGVRALRLTPVGDGNVFGRAGLLAHTYMLGPKGDSNGCVVFKDYSLFLQAFENGDVKRLAVVSRLD